MYKNSISDIRKGKLEELFRTYPVLKTIDDDNSGVISSIAQFKTMEADECISSAKGTCQGILFVMKGKINIKRINEDGEETDLYNISEGELCHEALSCLLNYKSLNIVGTALQACEICVIPIETVKKFLLGSSKFLSYMYKDIYERFALIIEKKEDKNHKSVEKRIIEYLINRKTSIIYATHKDIAYAIDSRREVVSRKLKVFEKEGYIRLERGKIIIIRELKEFFYS